MILVRDQFQPTIVNLAATLFGKLGQAILVVVMTMERSLMKSFLLKLVTHKSKWWKSNYLRAQNLGMVECCLAQR